MMLSITFILWSKVEFLGIVLCCLLFGLASQGLHHVMIWLPITWHSVSLFLLADDHKPFVCFTLINVYFCQSVFGFYKIFLQWTLFELHFRCSDPMDQWSISNASMYTVHCTVSNGQPFLLKYSSCFFFNHRDLCQLHLMRCFLSLFVLCVFVDTVR